MKNEKLGAEDIYLAPEQEISEESPFMDKKLSEEILDDNSATVELESKENVRMGEILNLRGNNRKVYRMSDGTEQAVFYSESVHVFDDEKRIFDEVDNTFIEEEDGRHFVNRKNRFMQ